MITATGVGVIIIFALLAFSLEKYLIAEKKISPQTFPARQVIAGYIPPLL